MSISISDLIEVNIAIAPNAIAVDGFGPLLFMSKEYKPVAGEPRALSFSSLVEVQEKFPGGEIYKAATAWYGQKPRPKIFIVGAILRTTPVPATTAKLIGGSAAVLTNIKKITAGSMALFVNGTRAAIDGQDLSASADLDAVAANLTTKFNAVLPTTNKIAISQLAGVFTVATEMTGGSATLTTASGDIGVALKLTPDSNATVVPGEDAKSISSDLAAITNLNMNFFYVALERSLRKQPQQLEAARWCEASGKVFGWADNDANILVSGTENSFKQAKDSQLQNTICVFDASNGGVEYPEVSILGRAATVNFNVANSVLILAYKKGPGITVADLSSGQLKTLMSYGGNAFINVGGNAMFYNGRMADGTWFDTVQGVEWLKQKIRNNVFNLFYTSTTRVPWSDTGVAMVNQQVINALELARTNGLVSPGYDNEGNFYPDGYKVMSTSLGLLQSQKGKRIWEGTSFIAIGSGALQGATISGTFVQ